MENFKDQIEALSIKHKIDRYFLITLCLYLMNNTTINDVEFRHFFFNWICDRDELKNNSEIEVVSNEERERMDIDDNFYLNSREIKTGVKTTQGTLLNYYHTKTAIEQARARFDVYYINSIITKHLYGELLPIVDIIKQSKNE